MQKTLGAFIHRRHVETPQHFYRYAWEQLVSGPTIVRPKRIGAYEPLKRVDTADLPKILSDFYFFSNGRAASGAVMPPTFVEHQYFDITIRLHLKATDSDKADEVYDWLRESFRFDILYMGTVTDQLFRENLEFHQMLNRGLVEIELDRAMQFTHLLDRFERAA